MSRNQTPYVTSNVLTNPNLRGGAPGAQVSPYRGSALACKSREGAHFRGARAPATPDHRWLWRRACAAHQMERRLVSPGRLLLGDRLQSLTRPRPPTNGLGWRLGTPMVTPSVLHRTTPSPPPSKL